MAATVVFEQRTALLMRTPLRVRSLMYLKLQRQRLGCCRPDDSSCLYEQLMQSLSGVFAAVLGSTVWSPCEHCVRGMLADAVLRP